MNTEELFSNLTYAEEMHKAESELSAFISAVTQLCGPEHARLATEDWLDESALMIAHPDRQAEIGGLSRSLLRLAWQVNSVLQSIIRCLATRSMTRAVTSAILRCPNVTVSALFPLAIFV